MREAATEPPRRPGPALFAWVGLLLPLAVLHSVGLPYYLLPVAGRVRHPLHVWLKPSGYVGQSAGILAAALFVFLWLYPLRKRVRWLAFTGSVGRWLDVHIFVGLAVPLLGAVHAAWRFSGLIGLGYAAMLLVGGSGIVGRYLYTRIPRRRNGVELSIDEVRTRQDDLTVRLACSAGVTATEIRTWIDGCVLQATRSQSGLVRHLLLGDIRRYKAVRVFRARMRARSSDGGAIDRRMLRQASRLATRRIALEQKTLTLDGTRRLFRYWHVAHRPIAITALLAVTLHVAVVVALGVTWLW